MHLFVCLHSAKAVIPLGGNKTVKFHTFAGGENFSRLLQTHGLVWGEIRGGLGGESSRAGFPSTFICFCKDEGEILINSCTGAARPSWKTGGCRRNVVGDEVEHPERLLQRLAMGWAWGSWRAGSQAHPHLSAPLQGWRDAPAPTLPAIGPDPPSTAQNLSPLTLTIVSAT